MGINVTLGEAKTQENPFPKLIINPQKWIFFASSEKSGVWITGPYAGEIVIDKFNPHDTVDYNEPITLQNA